MGYIIGVVYKRSEVLKWDSHGVELSGSGIHTKWDAHGVGCTRSGTRNEIYTKLDTYGVGYTWSGINMK